MASLVLRAEKKIYSAELRNKDRRVVVVVFENVVQDTVDCGRVNSCGGDHRLLAYTATQ